VPAMKYVSYLVLFLLAYMFFFRPLRTRLLPAAARSLPAPLHEPAALPAGGTESMPSTLAPAHASEAELASAPEHAAIAGQVEETPTHEESLMDFESLDDQLERELLKEANLDTGGRKSAILRKRLIEKAKKEPEVISQLVRSWIQERA